MSTLGRPGHKTALVRGYMPAWSSELSGVSFITSSLYTTWWLFYSPATQPHPKLESTTHRIPAKRRAHVTRSTTLYSLDSLQFGHFG